MHLVFGPIGGLLHGDQVVYGSNSNLKPAQIQNRGAFPQSFEGIHSWHLTHEVNDSQVGRKVEKTDSFQRACLNDETIPGRATEDSSAYSWQIRGDASEVFRVNRVHQVNVSRDDRLSVGYQRQPAYQHKTDFGFMKCLNRFCQPI
jgi:hypothetical protein